MIKVIRQECNDRFYTELVCNDGDLQELNSNYTNLKHGSIANIIGSRNYYVLSKTQNEWVLVRNNNTQTDDDGNIVAGIQDVLVNGVSVVNVDGDIAEITTLTDDDVNTAISTHNSSNTAHSDIRTALDSKANSSDISTAISSHDEDTSAHEDIRSSLSDKYEKPSDGIPSSDLDSSTQTILTNAITSSDLSAHNSSNSAHEDIRTSISNITPSIQTTLNGTCNANTKYYLGEVSTLNLTLPDEPSINDEIYISFYNPTSTATIISINDFYNGSIDNTEGYHGEIDLLYDGTIWNVAYIEQEVL